MNQSPKIGYVLKRFPRLSETFILNELLELERNRMSLQIYSLLDPALLEADKPQHKLVHQLQTEVIYLPPRPRLKKWRIKRHHFPQNRIVQPILAQFCGGSVPSELILMQQAGMVGCLARTQGVTHLHAHFGTDATTVAMLASRLTGLPFSFTAHAKDIFHASVNPVLLKKKIAEARFVVTVSDFNRQYLVKLAGSECAGKIIRVYNGIDLETFKPEPSRTREQNLILAVGRLEEKKGFHQLVRACKILEDQGQSFRCLIVGEGQEHEPLINLVAASGLKKRVKLTGALPQEKIIAWFKCAALFVLPCVISSTGDRDGLPTVLLEAMGMGLPVVSTHLAGIPEIIAHGKTGLLVPPGDPAALAGAITELVKNKRLRSSMGRAGRAKAKKLFNLRLNVPKLCKLFMRAAAGDSFVEPVLSSE